MLKITSLQNDKIKAYFSLKTKSVRENMHLFLLDDKDLINRAYKKNLIETILFKGPTPKYKNVELIEVTDSIIKKLSSVQTPSDMIGVCKMVENRECDNFVVALDDVQDPGNGGTIARSALAFNFNEMLLSKNSFDKYNEKFVRATKGSFFDISIKKVDLLDELIKRKQNGYQIVIADLKKESITLSNFRCNDKMVLVLGNEGNGISNEIRKIADVSVYIPISNKIESLNVGVAGSIIMQYINK